MNKETKKKIGKYGMTVCKIAIIAMAILAVMTFWRMYSYFQENPQKEFEYRHHEAMPDEAQKKLEMYENTRQKINIGLIFLFFFFVFEHFKKKKDSTFSALKEIVGKVGRKFDKYV